MLRLSTIRFAGVAAAVAICAPVYAAAQQVPAYVAAAVANPARPAGDTARDAGRKPAETVAFAGVKPGDKVGELQTGPGYFTRILAKVAGPKGHVYAINGRASPAIDMLAADPAYGNISQIATPMADLKAPEPLDVVWTTENYHDMHNGGGDMLPMNKAIFAALKPGGVYIVEDHAAAAGASPADMKTNHRIDPAIVRQEVTAAGFVLDGQSDVLKVASDPHTAPSSSLHDASDRFLFRFRKPR